MLKTLVQPIQQSFIHNTKEGIYSEIIAINYYSTKHTLYNIMNQTPQTETMDETIGYIYREMIEPFVPEFVTSIGYVPWMFSLIGSALVGLAGILPLLVIPVDAGVDVKDSDKDRK